MNTIYGKANDTNKGKLRKKSNRISLKTTANENKRT